MTNIKNILKDTPEYESYSRNEAKLTTEEMQELGINTCKKGCCNKQSNGFQKCCQTKNSGICFENKTENSKTKCCCRKK